MIAVGLAAWSAICAATGTVVRFPQLLFFRAAEGLGESFYFPASMSLLADYHGPKTRSRAMSLHQTSVYAGTAAGGMLAGYLGQRYGWRSPFWILGVVGILYAIWLPFQLDEPDRGKGEATSDADDDLGPPSRTWASDLGEILVSPAALMLLATFAAANFVAMAWLAWLPQYVKSQFHLDLTSSAAVASLFLPVSNFVGAILGGVLADRAGGRPGGRILVQAAGLLLGAPCVYAAGTAGSIAALIPALIGIGLCKGVYDANIFASIFDLIPPRVRGTAAGLMNTIGWAFGSLAPWLIGRGADRKGLAAAIAATAVVYLFAGRAGTGRRGSWRESPRDDRRTADESNVLADFQSRLRPGWGLRDAGGPPARGLIPYNSRRLGGGAREKRPRWSGRIDRNPGEASSITMVVSSSLGCRAAKICSGHFDPQRLVQLN